MNQEQRKKNKERNGGTSNLEPKSGASSVSLFPCSSFSSSFRRSWFRSLFFVLCSLFVGVDLSAHRLDEYLQATRIDLQTDAVLIDLDLTAGVAVAESIIALIDSDRDGTMSGEEQRAYASEVVRALQIELDGEPLVLYLVSSTFPELSALRRGEGMIQLRLSAAHHNLPTGEHQLFFRNAHFGAQSVYLANALVPESARVAVRAQRRDDDQRELTIDYSVRSEWAGAVPWVVFGVGTVLLLIRFRQINYRPAMS